MQLDKVHVRAIPDLLVLANTKNGQYSVKSGYKALIELNLQEVQAEPRF
jgi:hypothetical protein